MDGESPYWLFGWLEAHRVKTANELHTLLGKKTILRELREVADAWADADPTVPQAGFNLIAGTGLRLDDLLTCPSFMCRRQQVDVLFRHAWHYFDRILLPDGVGHYLRFGRQDNESQFLERLASWIALAMYIRDLEATDLVVFYPKYKSPLKNFLKNALREDYPIFLGAVDNVKQQIVEEAEFKFHRKSQSEVHVSFYDPLLERATELDLIIPKGRTPTDAYLRTATACDILNEHIAYLSEDLHAKKHLTGTLGSIVWTHEVLLSRIGRPIARDVVLKLSLPSIDRIPVKELIAIRSAEGDSFASFRAALTTAAQKVISTNPRASADELSQLVVEEVIQPELAKIEQRLRAAKRALTRKTAISLAVGTLATKCGLLFGMGPVAGSIGVGATIAGSIAAGSKYIEEKQSIELSDMYFLWKALGHAAA